MRLAEEDCGLERENVFAIEILVQAVVIALTVLEEQRRRAGLPRSVAALDKRGMGSRKADIESHPLVPTVGDSCELGIKSGPQLLDQGRQRICEVFIFTASKAVSSHDDVATESFIYIIEARDRVTLIHRQQLRQNCPTLGVEMRRDGAPIDHLHPIIRVRYPCCAHDKPRLISSSFAVERFKSYVGPAGTTNHTSIRRPLGSMQDRKFTRIGTDEVHCTIETAKQRSDKSRQGSSTAEDQ